MQKGVDLRWIWKKDSVVWSSSSARRGHTQFNQIRDKVEKETRFANRFDGNQNGQKGQLNHFYEIEPDWFTSNWFQLIVKLA